MIRYIFKLIPEPIVVLPSLVLVLAFAIVGGGFRYPCRAEEKAPETPRFTHKVQSLQYGMCTIVVTDSQLERDYTFLYCSNGGLFKMDEYTIFPEKSLKNE